VNKKSKQKYAKPVSLHPLKPEEAISAFMQVKPKEGNKAKGKSKKYQKEKRVLNDKGE